ncbi:MAG: glycosyltransferase family 4 protein [Patescibacteria group bacterium]
MKICQLTCVYPPYGGGIGYVAYHYARLLASPHEVTVLTPLYNKGLTFAQLPGVKVAPFKPWVSIGKAAFNPTILGRLKDFDIVHLHYPFFGVHEWLAKLSPKQKLVMTFHMTARGGGLKDKVFLLDTKLTARALARRADAILCATQDYMREVGWPLLGETGKWRVMPFGVEARFTPAFEPSVVRQQYNIKREETVLLFVGTLDQAHAFKGLGVLLASLVKLKKYPWRLMVVGAGKLKTHYAAMAQKLGLAPRVNFVGFVKDRELPLYYQAADIFLFPSTSQAEAFGLAALQAMATGLPVIASRLPGVRELIKDGQNGLLAVAGSADSLAAAIDILLNNPDKARHLGQNGAQRARQNYQWDKLGQELDDLYRGLL